MGSVIVGSFLYFLCESVVFVVRDCGHCCACLPMKILVS